MTLSNDAIRDTLRHVLTEYDRQESRKASYNPYALGLYMETLGSAMKFINAGADVREVLLGHLNGRLLAKCLKALRLAPETATEARSGAWVRRESYGVK